MKRLTILFMLFLTSCILYAKDRKGNDLSGPIALKGELTEKYQNYTKGTPIVIRGVNGRHHLCCGNRRAAISCRGRRSR